MTKQFESNDKVFESFYSRYTAGCFSIGDIIKFNKSAIKKHECYKNMQPELKLKLDDMMKSVDSGDAIITVTAISLPPFEKDSFEPATMTIAYNLGGGRTFDPITISGSLIDGITRVDNGVNLPNTIPDNAKIDYDKDVEKSLSELDTKEVFNKKNNNGIVKSTTI